MVHNIGLSCTTISYNDTYLRAAKLLCHWSSGCGAVGRAVASKCRDPKFESGHWQNVLTVLKRRK